MYKRFLPTLVLATVAGILPAQADFGLFEDFDSIAAGGLNGNNGWTAISRTTVVSVGGDKVASIATGATGNAPNFKSLVGAGLSIPNTNSASTVYWNFSISATTGNNWNFIVTDDAAPADTGATSEVQFNWDNSATGVRARSAGNFITLSTDGTVNTHFLPIVNVVYNAWFEINNTNDTYRLYLQSDADPLLSTRTQMVSDAGLGGTFTFRNSGLGLQNTTLQTLNFGSTGSASVIQFDDFYVDTAGFNSANPTAVPEPASAGLLLLAGLAVSSRRRRS